MIEYVAPGPGLQDGEQPLEGNNGLRERPEARTGMDGEDGGACRLSESRSLVASRNWRPEH